MNTTESIGESTTHTAKRPDSFTTPSEMLMKLYNVALESGIEHECMREIKEYFRPVLSVRDVKLFVCKCFGYSEMFADMKTRRRESVTVRQITMKLCWDLKRWTQAYIGSELGGYDHATVLHGIKTVKNHYETEKDFRKMYDEIEKQFKKAFDL